MYGYIFHEHFIIHMVFVFASGFGSLTLWSCILYAIKKEKLALKFYFLMRAEIVHCYRWTKKVRKFT